MILINTFIQQGCIKLIDCIKMINELKKRVKVFIMLQKIFLSNKCYSSDFV